MIDYKNIAPHIRGVIWIAENEFWWIVYDNKRLKTLAGGEERKLHNAVEAAYMATTAMRSHSFWRDKTR